MSKMARNFEGVTTTRQYLTVHFTEGSGSVKRLRWVKVPWSALLDSDAYEHLDRAEVRRLKLHWEGAQSEIPWD